MDLEGCFDIVEFFFGDVFGFFLKVSVAVMGISSSDRFHTKFQESSWTCPEKSGKCPAHVSEIYSLGFLSFPLVCLKLSCHDAFPVNKRAEWKDQDYDECLAGLFATSGYPGKASGSCF